MGIKVESNLIVLRKSGPAWKRVGYFALAGVCVMLAAIVPGMKVGILPILAILVVISIPISFIVYGIRGPEMIAKFDSNGIEYSTNDADLKEVVWESIESLDYSDSNDRSLLVFEVNFDDSPHLMSTPFYGALEKFDERRFRLTINIGGGIGFSFNETKNLFSQISKLHKEALRKNMNISGDIDA